MEKRELAVKLMEIDSLIDKFQDQLLDAGVDTGNSVLQFIDIPRLVAEVLGVAVEDLDMADEGRPFLDGTAEASEHFINGICEYVAANKKMSA